MIGKGGKGWTIEEVRKNVDKLKKKKWIFKKKSKNEEICEEKNSVGATSGKQRLLFLLNTCYQFFTTYPVQCRVCIEQFKISNMQ